VLVLPFVILFAYLSGERRHGLLLGAATFFGLSLSLSIALLLTCGITVSIWSSIDGPLTLRRLWPDGTLLAIPTVVVAIGLSLALDRRITKKMRRWVGKQIRRTQSSRPSSFDRWPP
jgi:vacuolar-type H+-ATPase subunit I/STV1